MAKISSATVPRLAKLVGTFTLTTRCNYSETMARHGDRWEPYHYRARSLLSLPRAIKERCTSPRIRTHSIETTDRPGMPSCLPLRPSLVQPPTVTQQFSVPTSRMRVKTIATDYH